MGEISMTSPPNHRKEKTKVKVNRNRDFHAHHMLIGAARVALEDAINEKPGYFYSQLAAITFSALALEAMANSFGDEFVPNWKHFENSSPQAKLIVINKHFGKDIDFDADPWKRAYWLIKIRNKIVHAKPQVLKEEQILTRDKYDLKEARKPKSSLEQEITLNNAKKSVEAANQILQMLCDNISAYEAFGFSSDSWEGSATVIRQ